MSISLKMCYVIITCNEVLAYQLEEYFITSNEDIAHLSKLQLTETHGRSGIYYLMWMRSTLRRHSTQTLVKNDRQWTNVDRGSSTKAISGRRMTWE